MKNYIALPTNTCSDFIQYSVENKGCRLIALDILLEGSDEGLLCEQRLDWLELELSRDQTIATYIFFHHHPFDLHLPMQDGIRLLNGKVLLEKLNSAKKCYASIFWSLTSISKW